MPGRIMLGMTGKRKILDTAWAASGMLILALCAAVRAEPVRPTLDVTFVHLEVIWVNDDAEFARVRERFHKPHHDLRASASIGSRTAVRGFSVLRRTPDGTLICTVYVRKPRRVDDQNTLSLGHEVAHCLLGDYH
jgi:hypothetical protein